MTEPDNGLSPDNEAGKFDELVSVTIRTAVDEWRIHNDPADVHGVSMQEHIRRALADAGLLTAADDVERMARELYEWRTGARRRTWPTVAAAPDGVAYAAYLARAQGTEGGEEHDRLLREAAQRMKALHDAAQTLLEERRVLAWLHAEAVWHAGHHQAQAEQARGDAQELLGQRNVMNKYALEQQARADQAWAQIMAARAERDEALAALKKQQALFATASPPQRTRLDPADLPSGNANLSTPDLTDAEEEVLLARINALTEVFGQRIHDAMPIWHEELGLDTKVPVVQVSHAARVAARILALLEIAATRGPTAATEASQVQHRVWVDHNGDNETADRPETWTWTATCTLAVCRQGVCGTEQVAQDFKDKHEADTLQPELPARFDNPSARVSAVEGSPPPPSRPISWEAVKAPTHVEPEDLGQLP